MESAFTYSQTLTFWGETTQTKGYLTETTLTWEQKGQIKHLALQDVVGVKVVERKVDNLNNLSDPENYHKLPCLMLYAYPVVRKVGLAKRKLRSLQEYCFSCPDLTLRSQWQQAINHALLGKAIHQGDRPRHLQIVINPVSGKKKAAQIFEQIRPLFDQSNLEYSLTQTFSAVETKNLAYSLDLSKFSGLVIVGGDGTIHDAIAGLMARPDWQQAINIPLGIIPGGTGNGFCKSLLESAGEAYQPINAAFLIAKGKQTTCDLATVKQKDDQYHSFLSLSWGLISDADIKSEKLSWLGSLRFDIYALALILLHRHYRGKFSFIPHPECNMPADKVVSQQGKWQVIEAEFIFLWAMNVPWAAHDLNVTPHASLNDGAMDVLIMRQKTSRRELLMALLRCGKGQHLDLPNLEYYKVRAFRLEPLSEKDISGKGVLKPGILVVDGEQVPYSPIEMEIVPKLLQVNC